jgi:hypothetical protein
MQGLPSMTVDGVLSTNESASRSWEADLMQAAYLLELLCRYRLEAEVSRAKLYVNIHKFVVAGNAARADDLRRLIPATEATVVMAPAATETPHVVPLTVLEIPQPASIHLAVVAAPDPQDQPRSTVRLSSRPPVSDHRVRRPSPARPG